ncbi:hypothetical protein OROMI_030536 [Orobanche minor]
MTSPRPTMSSSSTISISISSIFLLFLMPNIIVTSAKNTLIEKVCSDLRLMSKSKLCIQVLQSRPKIISATNLYDLSIVIMQSGISNATRTRAHIENILKKPNVKPDLKAPLQDCKSSYDLVILSFNSALREVKDDKEYDTATYDLLIGSTDYIQPCLDGVASGKIKDSTISNGNNVVPIYGLSAYRAIESLDAN